MKNISVNRTKTLEIKDKLKLAQVNKQLPQLQIKNLNKTFLMRLWVEVINNKMHFLKRNQLQI